MLAPMARRLAALVVCLLVLGAPVLGARPAAAANDPLEEVNRFVHGFNGRLHRHLLAPLARAYVATVPQGARDGIANMVRNLGEPVNAVGGLAAGDLAAALTATSRFAINTTIGLGGIHDRAVDYGFARRAVSLADAACAWGVPSGPYLVLPLVGPSTARDAGALALGGAALYAALGPETFTAMATSRSLVDYAEAEPTVSLVQAQSLDAYAVFRSAYLQQRARRCTVDRVAMEQRESQPDHR